jgi:hypothetical protein
MTKPFPALCKDCKWSKPERRPTDHNNRCFHPKVVCKDSWALANNNFEGDPTGVYCRDERRKYSLFAACGMKGKLWEPRANDAWREDVLKKS